MATVLAEVGSNAVVVIGLVVGRGVDTNLDPGEETVGDILAQVDELGEGVVGLVGLEDGPHVLGVGGDLDGVGVVGGEFLDGLAQRLRPEELADVGDGSIPDGDGAIGHQGRVCVRQQVGVDGTALVVAGEDGLELDDTVVVGELDTTEEGGVQAGLAGLDAGVDTGGVAVPDVDGDLGDGIAGVDVDVLDLEEDGDTVAELGLDDVGAHVLADDVVGAVGDLRGEDAGGVGAEDVFAGGEDTVGGLAGHVVVDGLPGVELVEVAAVLLGGFG